MWRIASSRVRLHSGREQSPVNKRASGPPRRPRNPVAKAVRTPLFKPQVVPDKRWNSRLREEEAAETPEKADRAKSDSD